MLSWLRKGRKFHINIALGSIEIGWAAKRCAHQHDALKHFGPDHSRPRSDKRAKIMANDTMHRIAPKRMNQRQHVADKAG